jgi:hypothetical protein
MFNLDAMVFGCVWYWVTSPLYRWANFTAVLINQIYFNFTLKQVYRVASKSIPGWDSVSRPAVEVHPACYPTASRGIPQEGQQS